MLCLKFPALMLSTGLLSFLGAFWTLGGMVWASERLMCTSYSA